MSVGDDVTKRVDKFIDQLLASVIKLESESRTHAITIDGKHHSSLRDITIELIHEYQRTNPEARRFVALKLLRCIDEAYGYNLVEEGKGMSAYYNTLQQNYSNLVQSYNELNIRHQKLADDFIFLQGKNKQLEELLERIVPKRKDIDQ